MKTLYAHFDNILEARKAVEALKEKGFKGAHIDAPGFFNTEYSMDLSFNYNRKNHSLSSLVLKKNSFMYNTGSAPLTAAHPEVSGMGGDSRTYGAVVSLKVENEQETLLRELLRHYGGRA